MQEIRLQVGFAQGDLLAQVEKSINNDSVLARVASLAYGYLSAISRRTAVEQEAAVRKLMAAPLGNLSTESETDAAAAVASVVTKHVTSQNAPGSLTATEKVRAAMAELSRRYQADW